MNEVLFLGGPWDGRRVPGPVEGQQLPRQIAVSVAEPDPPHDEMSRQPMDAMYRRAYYTRERLTEDRRTIEVFVFEGVSPISRLLERYPQEVKPGGR